MGWRDEPKPMWLISPQLYNAYLDSLLIAKVLKIEGRLRYSRSWYTAYLRGLKATLATRKHEHVLYIFRVNGKYFADWYFDGTEVAVLDMGSYYNPHPILAKIFDILETLVRTGRLETETLSDTFEVEMYDKPSVILFE